MKEILKKLEATEKLMLSTSTLMMDSKNKEMQEKGRELFGALRIVRNWIENIKKETRESETK